MKTIIAGSRGIVDYSLVGRAVEISGFAITEVVSGAAKGVDQLGERWADENKIPVTQFYPNWHIHGRAGGMIRNARMAEYADALIAIWDGKSKGTKGMVQEAKKRGLKVCIVQPNENSS